MFDLLLPRSVAGAYPGHVLALWILGLVALAKAAMGINCIFNGRTVATNADGVPLDSFGADGARTVVALFAIWGLCQLLFALISVVALARWRGLVPAVFLLLLAEHLGRKLILHFQPIVRTGSPPGSWVNHALLALLLAGFALSLWPRNGGAG